MSAKFWSFSLVMVLLFSVLTTAAFEDTTNVTFTSVKNAIKGMEEATYNLTLTNLANSDLTYKIYGLDPYWGIDPSEKKLTLSRGETKTVTVKVKPLSAFKPSLYDIKLYIDLIDAVTNSPSERLEQNLKIILYPNYPIDYLPSIKMTLDVDDNINPQQPVSIKLFLENKNRLNLSNLKIMLKSDMPEFNKEIVVNIPPLEKKAIEFTIIPNKFQPPKDYNLLFVFEHRGQLAKTVEKKITIMTMTPPFTIKVNEESVVLKVFKEGVVYNGGNLLNTQEVRVPVTFWQSLFSFGEDYTLKESGQRYLAWTVTLAPDETVAINFVTNYRMVIYLLILIAALVVFYFYVTPPISVRKTATTTKTGDQGTLSEIKVTLTVRNKSKSPVKQIKLVDFVPEIANVYKNMDLGTIKLHEVKHSRHGAKVDWFIPELEGREQRLIVYKVKAKLGVVGAITLDRARADFVQENGRRSKSYSNKYKVGI